MIEATGSIWDYIDSHWIITPVNQGWTLNGRNIMGAGVAKYVKDNYPDVPAWYGEFCRAFPGKPMIASYSFGGGETPLRRFVMFPTKPLNVSSPHLSWKSSASLTLIEDTLPRLAEFAKTQPGVGFVLPLIGCGLGGLNPGLVIPLLHKHLDDQFTLVLQDKP